MTNPPPTQVEGPRPYAVALSELDALATREARLPISCVEGWSASARWRGLSLLELVERAGGSADSRVRLVSLLIALWMVGAVAVHDGLLSPLVVAVGYGLRRLVPDRARRFLQFGLLAGALVTVAAAPLILRQGSEPPSTSLLQQDYGQNLRLLLGLIAVGTLGAYAVRVARDRTSREPGADHDQV